MISMIQPVPVGNALRLWLSPPVPSARIRLLRKETDDFAGWDDPDAMVVSEGTERAVTDFAGLMNGVPVFYRAYYLVNGAWVSSATRTATPTANFTPEFVDPLSIVRDRLELGLAQFVTSGKLAHERGYISVLTASPQIEDIVFPLVTVHLTGDAPEIRAIGEEVSVDYFDPINGLWHSAEGALSRTDLTIVGWALNADERIALRQALKAVLLANLPIFEAAGLMQVAYSFNDMDDYETYTSPMFQAVGSFNCLAASVVETTDTPIREVSVQLSN